MKSVTFILLSAAALALTSCSSDTDSSTPRLRMVEHVNPMGGPSTYTYRPDDGTTPALQH